jgi:tRNA (guanine37-N1)-methyltransferase
MRIDVLTLFPELFQPLSAHGLVGRAIRAGALSVEPLNFRGFANNAHKTVDDRPFGGGPGMVLMCGPVFDAVEHLESSGPPAQRILLTPQGEKLDQRIVRELAACPRLILICGHYEGFDERIRAGLAPRELSIGDYVLSGGEPAAMVLIDAVARLQPGALGEPASLDEESFTDGLLEYPQYTRPRSFRGMEVPEILLSGDHARIAAWRRSQSLERTATRRPDLLADRSLPTAANAPEPMAGAAMRH